MSSSSSGDRQQPAQADLTELLSGIASDAHQLIDQQLDLLRSEVREELSHAKDAALSLSAGAGLVATGGVLSSLMLVRLLHSSTRLPLWACYGVVGGLLGATGAGLLSFGAQKLAATQLLTPPQTAQALKENLTWLKEQTEISS